EGRAGCGGDRGNGFDSGEKLFGLADVAQIGGAPEGGREQLGAAVEQGLETLAQPPFEVAAPSELVDDAAGGGANVSRDKIRRVARITVGGAAVQPRGERLPRTRERPADPAHQRDASQRQGRLHASWAKRSVAQP